MTPSSRTRIKQPGKLGSSMSKATSSGSPSPPSVWGTNPKSHGQTIPARRMRLNSSTPNSSLNRYSVPELRGVSTITWMACGSAIIRKARGDRVKVDLSHRCARSLDHLSSGPRRPTAPSAPPTGPPSILACWLAVTHARSAPARRRQSATGRGPAVPPLCFPARNVSLQSWNLYASFETPYSRESLEGGTDATMRAPPGDNGRIPREARGPAQRPVARDANRSVPAAIGGLAALLLAACAPAASSTPTAASAPVPASAPVAAPASTAPSHPPMPPRPRTRWRR